MSWWKKTLKWVGLGAEIAGEVKGGILGEVLEKGGAVLVHEMDKPDAPPDPDAPGTPTPAHPSRPKAEPEGAD